MPELEDIKKNTGTAVPTEVSAETINPVQQPNININKTAVSAVATWTQPAQQNIQQPTQMTQPTQVQQWTSVSAPVQQPDTTVQSAQTNQQNIERPTEVRDLNDLRYADSLLNELVQGYPIYWNWMAVDSARARYNQYNALNGMTYQQIWDAVLTGEIAQNWTSMQDLKRYNPWLYDQTINYLINQKSVDSLNQLWQNLYDNYSWVETNSNYLKQTIQQETDTTKSIITTYSDDIIDFIKSYSTNATGLMSLASSMLNSPEIQQYKNNILALEWQIANINTDIAYVWDEARDMLGSSAPESLVSAYISQQTKHLQRQLMTYQNSLLVEQGKLDNAVDNVKTQLDYYAKWMDLWIDALKALMWWGSSSSSSSSSSKKTWTTWTTKEDLTKWTTAESVSKLKDAIVDWSFWWKFTDTALKEYWLTNTEKTTILKNIAQTLTQDDLDNILANSSKTNFKEIMKYYVEEQEDWIVDMLKNNINSLDGVARWFNAYFVTESIWKDLMKKAWYTTKQINEVSSNLWWKELEWEKATDMKQPEVRTKEAQDIINRLTIWKKDWVIPFYYAEQINKAIGAKKKVTSQWENAYNALMNWTFNKDKVTYWFSSSAKWYDIGSQIWANCSSANDVAIVLNRLDSEFDWENEWTALANIKDWVYAWYKNNWNIWTKAIKNIESKSASSKVVWNLKMYLTWIIWTDYSTANITRQLLKEAWVSADIIKKVL